MSETSRKRSRKSKLVPRDCTVEEDDIELQVPATKLFKRTKQYTKKEIAKDIPTTSKTEEYDTSVLKKINAPIKEVMEPTSPRKFEINIEVETCEDEFENLDETERLSPISKFPINKTVTNTEDDRIPLTPITLSHEKILDDTNNILKTSTNIADKILGICVRNTLGFKLENRLNKDIYEYQIQETLDEWRIWQYRSFHRENPLFYKCYICTKSWWHLSDFRNHVSIHPEVTIGLEKYGQHECNIIAYKSSKPGQIKDIDTKGPCYRCGKDFENHKLKSRVMEKYYSNAGCTKQFYSCTGSRDHFPCCVQCKIQDKLFKCDICRSRFDTEDDLNDHLLLSHTVRSDVPIMSRYKTCKRCLERYSCSYLHKCGKKCMLLQCLYCFKSFSNKMSMEIHMESSSKPCKCEVCGKDLTWSCQKYEHMMRHTDNFVLVRKCIKCDGCNVFVDNQSALLHQLNHMYKDNKHKGYFPKIIVPKSSILSSLEHSESVPEKQESTAKQESLPEEDDSEQEYYIEDIVVKEEPQDIEDNPTLVIKEEPIEEIEYQYEFDENNLQVKVKEEIEEDLEEYEDDLIKLDFSIEDLLIKKELTQESTQESIDKPLDSDDDTEESLLNLKQDSIYEPEVIIAGKRGRKRLYRCTKCGFKAKHREYRDHIDNDCNASTKHKHYTCSKCDVEFSSLKKYLGHFIEHGYEILSCPECLKQFYSFTKLGPHVLAHVKQTFVRVKLITTEGAATLRPDYQCKKCSAIVDVEDFFDHWDTHVSDSPDSTVKHLEPRPSRLHAEIKEDVLKECIKFMHKLPKDCNVCHRRFKRVNECKRHIIEHLLTDAYSQKHLYGELKCQICDNGYPCPQKYKQHMRDHASLPVYKCELCDRTFSDSSNFTKHKKVHNLKVTVCDLCGKKFQSKVSLAKHIEKHKTTEPVTCKLCNKIFYFESSYRRHVRYFHDKVTIGFRCVICNERFKSLKLKWDHMWAVHKERKNKADCPICFKSFRKYSDVRSHAKKDHNMEVSVFSVKNAKKSIVDIKKFLKNTSDFKLGKAESETLVVYDPDS